MLRQSLFGTASTGSRRRRNSEKTQEDTAARKEQELVAPITTPTTRFQKYVTNMWKFTRVTNHQNWPALTPTTPYPDILGCSIASTRIPRRNLKPRGLTSRQPDTPVSVQTDAAREHSLDHSRPCLHSRTCALWLAKRDLKLHCSATTKKMAIDPSTEPKLTPERS